MKFLSPRTHTIIGFIVGLALLLAPNIFGFNDVGGAATTIPRILGIIVLLSELMVKGSFSGMGIVPMNMHLAMDVILGTFLAISPWLFGFSDQGTNAWLPHLIVGLLIVGYVPMTRTNEEEDRLHHAHPAH
jgi:ACR3 family arsenite efflux pump ArsB